MSKPSESRPLLPDGYFWITDSGQFRVARKVGERDDCWLLDVFRNPDDAHGDRPMVRAAAFSAA